MIALNLENVDVTICNGCEDAYYLFEKSKKKSFDIVFLDWSLPPFESKKIYNGGDLVRLINYNSPNCKIIVLTSHTDAFTLYQINKDVNPVALLCKVDFMIDDFQLLYSKIIAGDKYESDTVKLQLKQITNRFEYLDNFNRQIITLLSRGVMTKNLPHYLPLSISAIDKRKAQIKDYFLLEKGDDEDIVTAAKKSGLI